MSARLVVVKTEPSGVEIVRIRKFGDDWDNYTCIICVKRVTSFYGLNVPQNHPTASPGWIGWRNACGLKCFALVRKEDFPDTLPGYDPETDTLNGFPA